MRLLRFLLFQISFETQHLDTKASLRSLWLWRFVLEQCANAIRCLLGISRDALCIRQVRQPCTSSLSVLELCSLRVRCLRISNLFRGCHVVAFGVITPMAKANWVSYYRKSEVVQKTTSNLFRATCRCFSACIDNRYYARFQQMTSKQLTWSRMRTQHPCECSSDQKSRFPNFLCR
jgi:hypothetical protein